MRALSIRQPWAWMIIHGGKWIENRTWYTAVRGYFLVHASATCTKAEYEHALDWAYEVAEDERSFAIPGVEELGGPWTKFIPPREELEYGGIIGVARLHDVLPPNRMVAPGWVHDWRVPGQYGLILHDRRRLPFLPCKGALGFWGSFEIRNGRAVKL